MKIKHPHMGAEMDDLRKILAKQGEAGIYPRLFRTFCRDYNWVYGDGHSNFQLIQRSFPFTLC